MLFDHTIDDYKRLLVERLPEYTLREAVLPAAGAGAGSTLHLVLGNQVLAKYGFVGSPPHPQMPQVLAITGTAEGKKRLDDIKHFVNKRNLIMKYLNENAALSDGLVLKSYRRWNDFTVGKPDSQDADVVFEHLAQLKKAIDKQRLATSRDWFTMRRFLHMTTVEQKRQMVIDLLAKPPGIFALDETAPFEKNRFVIKYRSARASPDWRLQLNSFRALHERVTGRENTIAQYVAEQMSAIASKLHEKYVLPQKIAEQAAFVKAAAPPNLKIYAQHDVLQAKFVAAHKSVIDNKRSAVHQAFKAAKEAVVGKHVRTHPIRALRLFVGKLVQGASAIADKVQSIRVPAPKMTQAEKMLEELKGIGQGAAETAGGAVVEHLVSQLGDTSSTPPSTWLQDLGWGTREIDDDKDAWENIGEHLNSMQKWENETKTALAKIKNASDSTPFSCADVDQVLRCHAKMIYHLGAVEEEYATQEDFFDRMIGDLEAAKNRLAGQEANTKRLAIEFEAQRNEAYRLLQEIDAGYSTVVTELRSAVELAEAPLVADTALPSGVDAASEFIDAPEA